MKDRIWRVIEKLLVVAVVIAVITDFVLYVKCIGWVSPFDLYRL